MKEPVTLLMVIGTMLATALLGGLVDGLPLTQDFG
jgi:hypothetical protein